MVYPGFSPNSFWNYQATCEVVGARYSAAPLGLITVAALLPETWEIRLVNRNTEALREDDLDWADVVMTGGMLPQQRDVKRIIALAHGRGKPVVVGGPDATSSPEVYEEADFLVLGEVEEIMDDFVAAWRAGSRTGIFRPTRFPDLSRSPVPRFDLLKLEHFMHVGVQLSRGCPFRCEFCNVIELNGREPRMKGIDQMLRELDALHALGYRGHLDFVDDNFVGNRHLVKPFLAELAAWSNRHGRPFEFSTEASINVADDEDLLTLMQDAGFFALFIGIETPDRGSLIQTRKRQNAGRSIEESIRKIYRHGMFVNAGFIIGFDAEKDDIAQTMIECIEATSIPVCMVGLLYALPNTQLSRRLLAEGRLHAESDRVASDEDADQCTSGLNYATVRPQRETLEDYRTVLRRIYDPAAFFSRVRRMVDDLDLSGRRMRQPLRAVLRDLRSFARIQWKSGLLDRQVRGPYWATLAHTLRRNPRALRIVVSMAALYLHLKPFAVFMDGRLALRLASLDSAAGGPTFAASNPMGQRPARASGEALTSGIASQACR